jgi:hypothetical protein
MTSTEYYLKQAQRCRRHADSISDDFARRGLIALAEEFEARSDLVEATEAVEVARQKTIDHLENGPPSNPQEIRRPNLGGDGAAADAD